MKSFGCARKLYNHYVDALCNAQIHFKNAIKKFNEEYDKKSYTKRSLKRKRTLGIEPTFRDLKGMPRFKSKKNNDFSYTTNNQAGKENDWHYIRLENGMLTIRMDYRGNFFVSLCVEYSIDIEPTPSKKCLGLDYAQQDFYVDSEGRKANYPHYYRKAEEKLAKEQRKLSRRVFGSNRWKKQKAKVQKLQLKVANQRRDWLHKTSYRLAQEYDVIMVENIDLRAMSQGLKLTDRSWICPHCGAEIADRDNNAAINIREAGSALLAW